jgi:hypothetical protein
MKTEKDKQDNIAENANEFDRSHPDISLTVHIPFSMLKHYLA